MGREGAARRRSPSMRKASSSAYFTGDDRPESDMGGRTPD